MNDPLLLFFLAKSYYNVLVFCYFDDGMKKKNNMDKHIFSFYSRLAYDTNLFIEIMGRPSG